MASQRRPPAPLPMKKILVSIIAIVSLASFAGCASGPQAVKLSPEQGAAALRITTATGAMLVLNKNPAYTLAAAALAEAVGTLLSEQGAITPETIREGVIAICKKNNVATGDVTLFVGLAQSIYSAYVTAYRPTVVSGADPVVKLYAQAFADGLRDATGALPRI
jgi:hypothetical protein